jgi:hypothetical protein
VNGICRAIRSYSAGGTLPVWTVVRVSRSIICTDAICPTNGEAPRAWREISGSRADGCDQQSGREQKAAPPGGGPRFGSHVPGADEAPFAIFFAQMCRSTVVV